MVTGPRADVRGPGPRLADGRVGYPIPVGSVQGVVGLNLCFEK